MGPVQFMLFYSNDGWMIVELLEVIFGNLFAQSPVFEVQLIVV